MESPERTEVGIDAGSAGERLDRFVCALSSDVSRGHARTLIERGHVRVDGARVRASHRLEAGQSVAISWLTQSELRGWSDPTPDDLDVLFEDEAIVVLDKSAGHVVHPGGLHKTGTVAQLAESRFGPLSRLGGADRPGIVHRLDKETSGVLLLAKTDAAFTELQRQFRERETEKAYVAIVHGTPRFHSEWIEDAIDRDPKHKERMWIVREGGRESSTYFEVRERFDGFALIDCFPKTGRTHQIRIHMASRRLPVVCDALYPLRQRNALVVPESAPVLARHALHAKSLKIRHPLSGDSMAFEAPLPPDLEDFIEWLRIERAIDSSASRRKHGRRRGR